MERRWALLAADMRREYGLDTPGLQALSVPEFRALLQGLSEQSRFLAAWQAEPKHLHDPADRAAVIAAARR